MRCKVEEIEPQLLFGDCLRTWNQLEQNWEISGLMEVKTGRLSSSGLDLSRLKHKHLMRLCDIDAASEKFFAGIHCPKKSGAGRPEKANIHTSHEKAVHYLQV